MNLQEAKLVGDIGGTNARFALVDEQDRPQLAKTYAAEQYESLVDAVQHYLKDVSVRTLHSSAIAVATRVLDDEVTFTNNERWSFSISALGKELPTSNLRVINDFTALALAVPHIPDEHLEKVGGGQAVPNEPIGVVGPGTGLGVGGMIPAIDPILNRQTQWRALKSEGGHQSATALTQREIAVLSVLSQRWSHVSAERFLSGPGLVNIVQALKELDKVASVPLTPEDITRNGLDGSDEQCVEALHLFCGMLGSFASDLSVTLGSFGGIYIGGGIVPRLGDFFTESTFRERFENKGRVSEELACVPTFVIKDPYPGLLGAARLLTEG